MKTNKNNKTHCIIKGCGGFKLSGDERCLKHVRQRYMSYWSHGIPSQNQGTQKDRVSLDTLDMSS